MSHKYTMSYELTEEQIGAYLNLFMLGNTGNLHLLDDVPDEVKIGWAKTLYLKFEKEEAEGKFNVKEFNNFLFACKTLGIIMDESGETTTFTMAKMLERHINPYVIVVTSDNNFETFEIDVEKDQAKLPSIINSQKLDSLHSETLQKISKRAGLTGQLVGYFNSSKNDNTEVNPIASWLNDESSDIHGNLILCCEGDNHKLLSFTDQNTIDTVITAIFKD